MARVEPVPGAPAAVADLGDERALVVADFHAGIELALRYRSGVEVDSRADERRERVLELREATDADRVVFLGDLSHDIGKPSRTERAELQALVDALAVPVTLVKGNHDGEAEAVLDVEVTSTRGARIGDVGFAHGHTWPTREVLSADVVCVGHEHPQVRLEDEVGGSRVERVWLRGALDADPFAEHLDQNPDEPSGRDVDEPDALDVDAELVVFPAFNELSGGTWVNVPGQSFLAPFLPDALPVADAYLLDGTRLGDYRSV